MSQPNVETKAKLTLKIECPECGETAEDFPLAPGKTVERKVPCAGFCDSELIVPAILVKESKPGNE